MSSGEGKPRHPESCGEIRTLAQDRLDGMLDEAAGRRLDSHLRACPQCREFFARREALAADLLTLGWAADAIAAGAMPRAVAPRVLRWRSISAVAASLLFMAVAGLYLAARGHDNRGMPSPLAVNETEPSGGADAPCTTTPGLAGFAISPSEGQFAVRLQSRNPRIHIVWLYDQANIAEKAADGEPPRQPASSG